MLKFSFSLFFLLVTSIFADTGYIIDNYKVDIKINEKNIYDVSENIRVDFLEPRRGIYRVIPEEFNGREIKVSNIKTNVQTAAKDEGNYIYLRLGNPNVYLTGIKNYLINYTYNIGWNRNSSYDEVYYNLIGNDWDTTIKKVEFSIELPKSFDSSKVNFTLGQYGSTNTSGVKWTVNGNTISGYTTVVLNPKESVTIALPLPKGYFNFTEEKMVFYLFKGVLYLIYLAIPGIAIWFYKKYKDKSQIIQTVEFYAPDNLTPTEVGYYIDGIIHSKDLTSLIFYWANKGYLKINEIGKNSLFSRAEFEIEFLKDDIESEKEFEKYMFKALAMYKDSTNKVNIKDLRNRFYKHIEKAAEILEIDLVMSKKTLYSSKSMQMGGTIRTSIFFIIASTFGYFYYFGATEGMDTLVTFALAIISILVTFIISGKIKSRTSYGTEILGRILGFKRFLETAEKRKLEMLLEENSSYFYNILPFTIVLGVSDLWADKFKDLSVEPPQWYSGPSMGQAFVLGAFMGSFNNSLTSLNDTMLSAPKAPTNFGGGGSSMGGGSSGGGAGGGGGGSW
ncbi:DUF2207 domain-containing protein [Cetobacterium somerae]|uniref:DUF2207 domain-containing protein n=1 Tax=Cetobacterium somerae TaxID=188913 RepID=UPI003D766856